MLLFYYKNYLLKKNRSFSVMLENVFANQINQSLEQYSVCQYIEEMIDGDCVAASLFDRI